MGNIDNKINSPKKFLTKVEANPGKKNNFKLM